MNYNDDDNWIKYVQIGAFAILSFVLIGFGYVFEQPCNGLDNSTLWCALHPVKWWNIIGVILVEISFALILGIYSLFLGVFYADKGEYNGFIALSVALFATGGILMFA